MITQEMVEVALQGWDSIPKHKDPSGRARMDAALKAVYPLILEQAAIDCEIQADEFSVGAYKRMARIIRNLKEKTDEAHNVETI